MNLSTLTDAENVSLKTIIFCGLSVLLVLVACICMLCKITVNTTLFDAAASFIFGIGGISSASFLTQRLTDWTYIDKKGDAAAKVAEATRPSAVSVTTPTTTVNTPPGA